MRASRACGRACGRRKAWKEEKQEEGGSVERAVGHIIKGIRLSEYFRDTIKRLLYGDRELSALFVSSRYSPLSFSLPPSPPLPSLQPVVPGAQPESRKLGCILIPVPAIFDPP